MTDKSPELSKARSDALTGDEPILAGVNSRVVADRRGAYLANNMLGLLELMSDAQKATFKRWNTNIAVRYAERCMHLLLRPANPHDVQHPNRMLDAIREWLTHPSDDIEAHIHNLEHGSIYTEDPAKAAQMAAHSVTASRLIFSSLAAYHAARLSAHALHRSKEAASRYGRIMLRGQLRAAYIILQKGDRLDELQSSQ